MTSPPRLLRRFVPSLFLTLALLFAVIWALSSAEYTFLFYIERPNLPITIADGNVYFNEPGAKLSLIVKKTHIIGLTKFYEIQDALGRKRLPWLPIQMIKVVDGGDGLHDVLVIPLWLLSGSFALVPIVSFLRRKSGSHHNRTSPR